MLLRFPLLLGSFYLATFLADVVSDDRLVRALIAGAIAYVAATVIFRRLPQDRREAA
jgi:hypothetical protein